MDHEQPSPDVGLNRMARISAELRRFTAGNTRRQQEFDQQLASAHYRSVRANLLLSVLTRARSGTLTANWREALALRPLERPAVAMFVDGDQLAVREVAGIAPAAWEPHSGAGWRRALDTWFNETLEAYSSLEDVHRETEAASRARLADQRDAIRRLHSQLGWPAAPVERPLPDHSPYPAPLFHVEAWYRAGLAGGGEDCDWVGWVREHAAGRARDLIDRLDDPDFRWQAEHLPDYWDPPAT